MRERTCRHVSLAEVPSLNMAQRKVGSEGRLFYPSTSS